MKGGEGSSADRVMRTEEGSAVGEAQEVVEVRS